MTNITLAAAADRNNQPVITFDSDPSYYRVAEGRWVTKTGMFLIPSLVKVAEMMLSEKDPEPARDKFEICPLFNDADELTGYSFDVLTSDGTDVWGCYWLVSDLVDDAIVSASEVLVLWDVNGVPGSIAQQIVDSLNQTVALGSEWSQEDEDRAKAALAEVIVAASKEV